MKREIIAEKLGIEVRMNKNDKERSIHNYQRS